METTQYLLAIGLSQANTFDDYLSAERAAVYAVAHGALPMTVRLYKVEDGESHLIITGARLKVRRELQGKPIFVVKE